MIPHTGELQSTLTTEASPTLEKYLSSKRNLQNTKKSDKFKMCVRCTNEKNFSLVHIKQIKVHRSMPIISKTYNKYFWTRFLSFCTICDIIIIIFGDIYYEQISRHSKAKATSDLCLPTLILTVITLFFFIKRHLFLGTLLYCEDLAQTRINSDFSWRE